jgi:RimJ/RimL family protein N-acetyltransferase
VPTLTTARLLLRPLVAADLPDVHRTIGSDPAVTWDGRARTLEESREMLDAKMRDAERGGPGLLAVVDRSTGAFLGWGGLQPLEGGDEVEVAYYLGREAWGGGRATELGREALRHGFEDLGFDRIVAVVRPGNTASRRVLAKLGMTCEGTARHYGTEVQRWSVGRDAWSAHREADR